MSKDASIGWMYEGAKGNVHREDYLLGKKVDKNFEKYSDVVNTQKAEAIDSIVGTRTVFNSGQSTGLKTSSLQKDIIKSEDPFVLVKVREETKRRELMDNPLMKVRLQNMLKTMMTTKTEKKKEKKSRKDKKKKKKKRSRSSSSSSSNNEEEKSRKERRQSSSPKRRRTSERSEQPKSIRRRESMEDHEKHYQLKRISRPRSTEKEKSTRRFSRSPKRDTSRIRSRSAKRYHSRSRSAERKTRRESKSPRKDSSRNGDRHCFKIEDRKNRRTSRSRTRSRSVDKSNSSNRQYDSHVPRHMQKRHHSDSSDSESDHKAWNERRDDDDKEDEKKKSYGLVEMRKRTAEEKEETKAPSKEYKLIKIPTGRGSGNSHNHREPRRVLTGEEKAARLAEMQDNVKWRNEVREKNVTKGRVEDDEEKDEADKNGYAPSFIRSQMREACDNMTVEKRLQSNKRGVQRSHGYMDRSFAKK